MRDFREQTKTLRCLPELFTLASDILEDNRELECAQTVLSDRRFIDCTGSLDEKHHCGEGGLLKHVHEVVNISLMMASTNEVLQLPPVDRRVLFLGGIFHDYGKVWDYEPVYDGVTNEVVNWQAYEHKRKIHHISRSNMEWVRLASLHRVDYAVMDHVSHLILSHHGQRAWGSPVAPATPEAWLLHLADMASARQDEIGMGVDHLPHMRKLAGV